MTIKYKCFSMKIKNQIWLPVIQFAKGKSIEMNRENYIKISKTEKKIINIEHIGEHRVQLLIKYIE